MWPINLGVDPRKSDQVVRGATNLAAWHGQVSAYCSVSRKVKARIALA